MKIFSWRIKRALNTIEQGGIIAYPTEAMYGLGCDPWNDEALLSLLELKQRDWRKGLVLVASDFNQLQDLIEPVSNDILLQLQQTWPGHITWLLPAREGVSELLIGEHDTLAIRVSAHPVIQQLCSAYGGPIVSTSANISDFQPARTAYQVRWQLPDVDYVLAGSVGTATCPSQIYDAKTGERIR